MNLSKLSICVFVLLAAAVDASGTPKTKEKYDAHGFRYQDALAADLAPEDFLLMPWGWTPGNEQVMQDIKECGFNMAGFVAPEHVKLVKKTGLKCIVDDPNVSTMVENDKMSDAEISGRVKAMTANLKDNACVYGYYIKDEPTPGLFPNLARWASAVRKADPDATPYINLLPGDGASYMEGYVEAFVKTVNPAYISYDRYALMDDGSVGNGLYTNLEAIRKVALKHGIPFWNIVLTNSHFHYAEVTPGGLNLQVYASLAYGCRGISYFTYFSPLIGNYRNAAVDQFLHKTPTWDVLRLLNLQIHQIAPTYLNLKSVNVFHSKDVPETCSGMNASRHLAEVAGGNFLVGEFDGPDVTPFVMVVNKDIHKSTGFQVKFNDPGTVMMTNPYTGETKPFGGENGWLAPGGGVLLSLKK